MKKTLVILANSVKNGQHCVAGKEIISKAWYRPVSDNIGSEISHEQAKCKNSYGIFPISVLQKIEINISHAAPLLNQPENVVIFNEVWLQRYKIDRNELVDYLDQPTLLWNNESSSSSGDNDRVSFQKIQSGNIKIEQSLYLLSTDNVKVIVQENYENKKRLRVSFDYNKFSYNLATTDPVLWKHFLSKEAGVYEYESPMFLCISLAGRFDDGFCYKLVASVL